MNIAETTKGPEWAAGCEYCNQGIRSEPEALTKGYTSFYLRHAIGLHFNVTEFCTCRAGNMARQRARKDWAKHGNDTIAAMARNVLANPQPTKEMRRE